MIMKIDENIEDIEDIENDSEHVDNITGVDTDIDENINKTTKEINEIVDNSDKMIEFDNKNDENIHSTPLENVYEKIYITSQYINKDDTIRTIKNKICCSIMNNNKFGGDTYIIPSRQYLWSNYFYEDQIKKVMIGYKWISKSNLLHINIEPHNNLKIYEELREKLYILKDILKRSGNKIKKEDENGLLFR